MFYIYIIYIIDVQLKEAKKTAHELRIYIYIYPSIMFDYR